MEAIAQVKDLEKSYFRTDALRKISIDYPRGSICGLIGPNGSGKTTLLKSMVGLVKPDSGQIIYTDSEIAKNTKEKVAFLPEINHLYKWMTIENIINFYDSQFQNFDKEKALEIVEFMNLKSNLKISSLSKGMAGRVKLVLVMAREVPLLLLDEPLAGIDPQSRGRILDSLITEFDVETQSVVLSTHEVLEAERIFDYVVFLEKGKVKMQGYADDLREEYNKSIQDIVKEVYK
ncbi:MAG: ABC transporter ATP-binding protein [Halanaerobiales bacterium]